MRIDRLKELIEVLEKVDPEKYDQDTYDYPDDYGCGCSMHHFHTYKKIKLPLSEYFDLRHNRKIFMYLFSGNYGVGRAAKILNLPDYTDEGRDGAIKRIKKVIKLYENGKI